MGEVHRDRGAHSRCDLLAERGSQIAEEGVARQDPERVAFSRGDARAQRVRDGACERVMGAAPLVVARRETPMAAAAVRSAAAPG